MYFEGKAGWLNNHLDVALEKYNNHVQGTTSMPLFEKSTNYKPSKTPTSNESKQLQLQVENYV